jgi:phosphoglycerol transferase MdoB-like AlkP superfamily enzyme
MSQGQIIAAAGGVLLFIFLFLPWFGAGDGDFSGWEGQTSTDVYLLITALVAVFAALTAGGETGFPGVTMNGATALLGGVGTILLLWLVIFDFPEDLDREIGLYLSLLAVAAIALGGYIAAQDRALGATRPPRRARVPREPL